MFSCRHSLAILLTTLLGTLTPLAAQAKPLKPGVSRWPIKTSLASGASTTHATPVDLSNVIALADVPGVSKDDARYLSKRIPDAVDGHTDGDIVSVTGWLHLVAQEPDGDYHIQISERAGSGNPCFIVEVPKDDAQFCKSAGVRTRAAAVRQFVRDRLLKGAEPSATGNVMTHSPYVRVTGQLFYDDAHVGEASARGKKGMHAKSLWEIHPITGMAFAPKP